MFRRLANAKIESLRNLIAPRAMMWPRAMKAPTPETLSQNSILPLAPSAPLLTTVGPSITSRVVKIATNPLKTSVPTVGTVTI